MATLGFLQMIGRAAVHKEKTLFEIGERDGWTDEETLQILRGKSRPTAAQLSVISKEFGISVDMLTKALNP
jgi:hypothetical protein